MSAEGGLAGAQGNCDAGNNGGSGSGSSTPNHLSQQNLIKIMKKIKSSASNVQASSKENSGVTPPNIMIGQPRPVCLDSLHPSGSTTPTGAD